MIKNTSPLKEQEIDQLSKEFEQLRNFTGKPGEFWAKFIQSLTRLAKAEVGFLLVKAEASEPWKNLCVWPTEEWSALKNSGMLAHLERIAEIAAEKDGALEHLKVEGKNPQTWSILGIPLAIGEEKRISVALFLTKQPLPDDDYQEIRLKLKLVSDLPLLYQTRRLANQAKNDVSRFIETLDLMVLLNAEKRYMSAAMTFCNDLAARIKCSRVSLGWLKDGYVRMQVISHMEKFEKKMDAVQGLEAAMEEALDQDQELIYPLPEDSSGVVKDHESFASSQGVKFMASVPLRLDQEPVAVITCERGDVPFTEEDLHGLRLICDQASRRLDDLKKHDRWFGPKMKDSLKDCLSKLLGVQHTMAKALGILIFVLLAILIFGKWEYRVEAPFILKTDDLAFLPAPFDGYIDQVHVQAGDEVKEKDLLLSLDTWELLKEESSALAERTRYEGESEKARAQNSLAEMKIALALKAQTEAKLELIRYHLANAQIKAPFAGVVVEGDLKELQGAPVRKGDVLFKLARIEKMYAELDLDERDVHEVAVGRCGEIAFVTMPQKKFPVSLEVINPVAVAKEEGNFFSGRCVLAGQTETWWRPGMSGIAKVEVGKRRLWWIFTHRTIDFLRMFFWY